MTITGRPKYPPVWRPQDAFLIVESYSTMSEEELLTLESLELLGLGSGEREFGRCVQPSLDLVAQKLCELEASRGFCWNRIWFAKAAVPPLHSRSLAMVLFRAQLYGLPPFTARDAEGDAIRYAAYTRDPAVPLDDLRHDVPVAALPPLLIGPADWMELGTRRALGTFPSPRVLCFGEEPGDGQYYRDIVRNQRARAFFDAETLQGGFRRFPTPSVQRKRSPAWEQEQTEERTMLERRIERGLRMKGALRYYAALSWKTGCADAEW